MIWQRFNCALGRHLYVTDAGHEIEGIAGPATCACGVTRKAIVWPRTSPPAAPTVPSIERVQIISAKPGDTIAILCKRAVTRDQRVFMKGLIAGQFPIGVKVMILEDGMELAHIKAGSQSDGWQPVPEALPQKRNVK